MSPEPPFSRSVKVDTLPRDGLEQAIEANPAERGALALENDLVELSKLTAKLTVKRSGRGVRVRGSLHAEAVQTCVVTLDPFPVTIEEEIDARFAPPSEERKREETTEVLLDTADEPDPLVDGKIDLGSIAAEFLALSLDPYPRKPGVEFEAPAEEDGPESPFTELSRLAKED